MIKSTHIFSSFVLILLATSCASDVSYTGEINQQRQETDSVFRYAPDSPIDSATKTKFSGLNYFPVSEEYMVEARLRKIPNPTVISMPYTQGGTEKYVRYAEIHFSINEKPLKLLAYRPVDMLTNKEMHKRLFIPFYDETNGGDTYGGGRYIEIDMPFDTSFTLDFNKAFNPYCAYNSSYTCPVPPAENSLPVAVKAGEKKFTKPETSSGN